MPISIQCSDEGCKAELICPDDASGRSVKCPSCQTENSVPKDAAISMGTLGGYELQKKIGEGGMGAVYEAIQTRLARKVAVKVLSHRFTEDELFLGRFQREAKSAAVLNHPNIVQVFDIDQDGLCHFFSMEFVEGETVLERMKREGKIPLDDALQIIESVTEALGDAIRESIIHRDIKPENIILSTRGRIKIADLGLAKSVDEEDQSMTQTGSSLGTPYYMSPEQAKDAASVDHRADIYALGITLLHMLTGKRPFSGKTAYAIILAHSQEKLPTGGELGTDLPTEVDALIQKMAAKKADERFQTYEDLLSEIRSVSGSPAVQGQVPGAPRQGSVEASEKGEDLQQAATVSAVKPTPEPSPEESKTESDLRGAMTMAAPPPPRQPPKALVGVIAVAALIAIVFILLTSGPNGPVVDEETTVPPVTGGDVSSINPDIKKTIDPEPASVVDPDQPIAANPAGGVNPLPKALTKTFEVPDGGVDNHNRPIRKGVDKATGYPLEVRHIRTGSHYVFIPAGKFTMGTPPDEPHRSDDERLHPVTLSRPFYMAKYETTVGEFEMYAAEAKPVTGAEKKLGAYVWDKGWKLRPDANWRNPYFEQTPKHPAAVIGHSDTSQFVKFLNGKVPARWMPSGKGTYRFSLPTEAQWEYACRAGSASTFYWGDDAARTGEYANVADKKYAQQVAEAKQELDYPVFDIEDGHTFTSAVGSFKPNAWGLYDMMGNIREWCADGMHPAQGPVTDPLGNTGKAMICLRGGSFSDGPEVARSGARYQAARYLANVSAGFRMAFRLAPDAKGDLAEKFKHLFEIPGEDRDQHGNPVRKGKDAVTGLPLEVRCRQTGMHLLYVAPGKFTMGAPEGEPHRRESDIQHEVTITLPFYLGKYEVTQDEFRKVFDKRFLSRAEQQQRIPTIWRHGKWQAQKADWRDPRYEQSEAHPVCFVSWADVQRYTGWLNYTAPATGRRDRLQFSLPTEAEWEYACRAGTNTRYYWGDVDAVVGEYANVYDSTFAELFKRDAWHPFQANDGHITAAPVGNYKPNPWGLYDMIGNVAEWCQDRYQAYPAAATDPVGRSDSVEYNLRGGAWSSGIPRARCGMRAHLYTRGLSYSVQYGFRTIFRLPSDRAEVEAVEPVREIVPKWGEGCVLAYSFNSDAVTFEGGRLTGITDLSTSKHHGKVLGGMMAPGRHGHALLFDDSTHGVECPRSEALEIEKELSVALWLKAGPQQEVWNRLVHQFHWNGKAGWAVNINGEDFEGGKKDGVDIEFFDKLGNLHGAFGRPVVTNGDWHFVAATFDGSTVRIYLNGQVVGERHLLQDTVIKRGPGTIMIGIGDHDEPIRGLRGVIDEVAIWRRALKQNEVREMFDYSSSGRSYCETLGNVPVEE